MFKSNKLLLGALLMGGLLTSCVSTKKYNEDLSNAQNAEQKAVQEAQQCQSQKDALNEQLGGLQGQVTQLESDNQALKNQYDQQSKLYEQLQTSYDDIMTQYKALQEVAAQNQQDLDEQLANKDVALAQKEKELEEKEKEMAALEAQLLAREERVKELEAALAERDAKSRALQESLMSALTGFSDEDLTVELRNGKVYVSLSQNLLFAKGRSDVDEKGVNAIEKLAVVLNKPENQEISVLVEGHTDSDGDAQLNWNLSTKRSIAITDILIQKGVMPERITAAGRGEHMPLVPNTTEDNKAKNRRTEIILEPNLDAIENLLNGE